VLQQISDQINRDGFAVVQLNPSIFTSRVGGILTNSPNATMIHQLQLLLQALHTSEISPVLLSDVNKIGSSWEPGQSGKNIFSS
jgi:hypothetical protein